MTGLFEGGAFVKSAVRPPRILVTLKHIVDMTSVDLRVRGGGYAGVLFSNRFDKGRVQYSEEVGYDVP